MPLTIQGITRDEFSRLTTILKRKIIDEPAPVPAKLPVVFTPRAAPPQRNSSYPTPLGTPSFGLPVQKTASVPVPPSPFYAGQTSYGGRAAVSRASSSGNDSVVLNGDLRRSTHSLSECLCPQAHSPIGPAVARCPRCFCTFFDVLKIVSPL